MEHWGSAKLRDLVTFVIGGDWGKAPAFVDEDYVDVYCIRGTELRSWREEKGKTAAHRKIKRSSLEKRRLGEGDLILEISGGGPEQPVGRVERIDSQVLSQNPEFPKICTNFFRKLEVTRNIDSEFLTWYLKYFYETGEVNKYQGGSNNLRNLKYPEYETLNIPVPPLNEQHRIVEKIDALFAQLAQGEAALRRVQALLARYRQSVLKAAVTGQLTADWRARNAHRLESGHDLLARILSARRQNWQGRGKYKEPVAPDTDGLPKLPEGWVWATLPMLGEFGRGKSKHRPRNDPKLYENGKYPFLQTGRIRNSNGRISEYDALYNETGLAQSRLWPRGTICITIAANIAETGILDIDACFPDSVVGLIPEGEVSGEYVEYFIRTAKDELDRYAPATAQKNINLAILEEVAVPLPSFAEQEEIVRCLDDLFAVADVAAIACQSELTRSAALRQSILKDAFAGKLVSQNPADEPASALLARIRVERETSEPRKARR